MTRRAHDRAMGRTGSSLVEILVTMVVVSIFMISLVPLTLRMARVSNEATGVTQRSAVMNGEVARLEALGFTELPSSTTCSAVTRSSYTYTTCVSVTSIDARTKQVRVIVTPSSGLRADTTVFNRYRTNSMMGT